MRYEDRVRSVVLVRRYNSGEVAAWGNGIFVECEERLYLVTCRHLVRSDLPINDGQYDLPEELLLTLRSRTEDVFENYELQLLNPRRWRTTATLKNLADVVVIQLPDEMQWKFDIVCWKAAELLSEPSVVGTRILILEQKNDGTHATTYHDTDVSVGSLQPQRQALIENAPSHISFGHSGSLLYSFIDGNESNSEAIDQKCIQAVGLVVGAKKFGGARPEMVLLSSVLPIVRSWEDYLGENGVDIKTM
jgi:hypothetical protein